MKNIIILILGLIACASSIIWIRESAVPPALLAGWRLIGSAVVLLPLFLRALRKSGVRKKISHFGASAFAGLMLALHFVFWIYGARLAPAANATLVVNLVPLVMPFVTLVMVGERVTREEWIATVFTIAGLLVLAVSDFRFDPEYLKGDGMCFISMLFLTVYLAMARRHRHAGSVWIYVVPLYFIAGVICMMISVFMGVNPVMVYSGREVLLIMALVLIPTVTGHSILNYSMRHLRAQVVSIAGVGQFVFGGIIGWVLYDEVPGFLFYAASALIVAGALLVFRGVFRGTRG